MTKSTFPPVEYIDDEEGKAEVERIYSVLLESRRCFSDFKRVFDTWDKWFVDSKQAYHYNECKVEAKKAIKDAVAGILMEGTL